MVNPGYVAVGNGTRTLLPFVVAFFKKVFYHQYVVVCLVFVQVAGHDHLSSDLLVSAYAENPNLDARVSWAHPNRRRRGIHPQPHPPDQLPPDAFAVPMR